LTPLPEHDGVLADASGADSQAASTARYRRRVLLTLGAIVLALVLYWASGYVFAYTDDAYVTSDLVSVAPYISGRVVAVRSSTTTRDQRIGFGRDRSDSFSCLAQKQAKRAEAEAQLAVDCCDRICAGAARRGGCQGAAGSDNARRRRQSRRRLLPVKADT
jgi:hypothetical protein